MSAGSEQSKYSRRLSSLCICPRRREHLQVDLRQVSDRVTRPYYWQLHRIEAHQAQSETTVDPSKEDEDDDNDHIPGELGIIRRDVHVLAGFWGWSAKS